jgi:ribulose-phosphate 3-epimerase
MQVKILPSLLAADFSNLAKDVAAVNGCGANGLHCDIMDGHFVPNITFGPLVVRAIKPHTSLPLYVHLMIERPEDYIEAFAEAGASEITVHAEACVHLHRTIQHVKGLGIDVGVALNPSSPLCLVENVISDINVLLIMTVNPGFGGQTFIETMLPKIERARYMAEKAGVDLDIAVDGGIDTQTAPKVVRAGANVLIAGTSIFDNGTSVKDACSALKLAAETALASRMV